MEQPTDTMAKLNGEVSDSDSFEIIQKAEVEQTIDDANNNAPADEATIVAEPGTSITDPDDNNNSNQAEGNEKKYSREFLLQIKQQVNNIKPELPNAPNSIIKLNSANLDSILTKDLNKPRQNHQQTNEDMFKMMTNIGRAPYTTRVSEQGAKRPQQNLKGKFISVYSAFFKFAFVRIHKNLNVWSNCLSCLLNCLVACLPFYLSSTYIWHLVYGKIRGISME